MTEKEIINIAEICHEANRILCQQNNDISQKNWAEAQEWQRESSINGVIFAIENPNSPASVQHDAWCKDKYAAGWVYGPEKDTEKKTHPCLVPFTELPVFQQKKDHLFKAIVKALAD